MRKKILLGIAVLTAVASLAGAPLAGAMNNPNPPHLPILPLP